LKVELGKAYSYIQELEDENKSLREQIEQLQKQTFSLTREEVRELKKSELFDVYKEEIRSLIKIKKKLQNDNYDLLKRNIEMINNNKIKL
jgi:cell division protein FtsB